MADVTAAAPAPRVRLDYLHGLRGLAALAVVVGHCIQLSQPEGAVPPLPLQWLRMAFNLAVPTFIVLSGYCLALPVVRHPQGRLEGGALCFMARRARRILPAYYGAVALSVLAAVTLTHTLTWAEVPGAALSPLLLLHDVWGSANAFDVPLWSLVIEWHIYCCVPALVWAWARYGPGRAALLAGTLGLLVLPLTNRLSLTHGLWPHLYTLFVMGWSAAYLTHGQDALCARARTQRWGGRAAGLGGGCLLAMAAGGWSGAYAAHRIPFQLLFGLATCCALLHLHAGGAVASWLSRRALVWLGERSYSLYLLHWVPCTVLASALAGPHWPLPVRVCILAALAVPLSTGLALISYTLLERPALTQRRAAVAQQPLQRVGGVGMAQSQQSTQHGTTVGLVGR